MRPAWTLSLAAALAAAPAWALKDELELELPDVATWVTGNGATRSVAWPDGSAALTSRWVVGLASVRFACSDGVATSLRLSADRGPNQRPHTIDLTSQRAHGGAREVELFLWPIDEVKAACRADGSVKVPSVTMSLELSCPKGVFRKKQTASLDVDCRVSRPSDEAENGLLGTKSSRQLGPNSFTSVMRFGGTDSGASPPTFTAGVKQRIEFFPFLLRVWKPTFRQLRPVRVDASGKVVERFAPCVFEPRDDPRCSPSVELTVKEPGPVRLALEAEYEDDTRLLSKVSELRALSTAQQAEAERSELPFESQSAATEAFSVYVRSLTDPQPLAVKKAVADFVASHPAFIGAGYNGHNFWANLKGGVPLMVIHQIPWKPSFDVKSPPAWLEQMKAGWEAMNRGDGKAASAAYQKALAEAEKLGANDVHVAATLNQLALSVRRHGQLESSIPLYRRALAIEEQVLTVNHPKVISTMLDLALMLRRNDPRDEERLLTDALARAEALSPPRPEAQRRVLASLADTRRRQGRVAEARELNRRADALPTPDSLEYELVQPDVVSYLETVALPPSRHF
ncbi:MAG: tetratricopeptide repeat protein [Myxococcales bacterium]|nr:tetratricopeptide repeat protein [Myxococcales bacterium]